MVACQWNISSPTGPAEQLAGGSFPKSTNSTQSVSKTTKQKSATTASQHIATRLRK
tara:strand:- start:346 stop:513 length:168 start_codon:yes stop_codon:yes gene_type:complete